MSTLKRARLLLDGYIRTFEASLDDRIIPISINELCFLFFNYSKVLFCLTSNKQTKSANIYMADIHSPYKNKILSQQEISVKHSWSLSGAGICSTTQFTTFPNTARFNSISNDTTVIFKCGGAEAQIHCDAFIIDMQSLYIERWKLPNLPFKRKYPLAAFLPQSQALISIDHTSGNVHSLCFKDIDSDKPKWKLSAAGTCFRSNMSVPITLDNNKLMFIGKETDSGLVYSELYDVHIGDHMHKFVKVPMDTYDHKGTTPGACYDANTRNVYTAGGSYYTTESYNVEKDKWYQFGHKLNYDHTKPIVWIENEHLLYAASSQYFIPDPSTEGFSISRVGGVCEFIDLRTSGDCKWEILFDNNLMKTVFGIECVTWNALPTSLQ